tara:strand:+ start:3104 stop:4246 length:1143 start_codon:yes stop_codon:yes gene_type:complete
MVFLISCKSEQKEMDNDVDLPFVLDLNAISDKIIDLSKLKPGERVLLVMAPGEFDDIINELRESIEAKNAAYLGTMSVSDLQPEEWTTTWISERMNKDDERLEALFEDVDLGIMLPGASPIHQPYKVLQSMLEGTSKRTIHFHWAGAYDLNGNLLNTDDEKSEFYQNVILNTDYKALSEAQVSFENAMRNEEIRVITEEGTDISFKIGDRPVTKQDGNASKSRASEGMNLIDREIEIPSGAIRVAPIEESVNGIIAFPNAKWDDTDVEDLKVTIESGKIVEIKASKGEEAVRNEMTKAGDAGRSFREFALGFNPMMTIQEGNLPWIPYYGYGAGVVRLSLGDNTELGGKVGGGYVRWNFFPNATVTVGDEIWVKKGKLLR